MTVITVRALIIASIIRKKPEILAHTFPDGSHFRASESFIRKFLQRLMGWRIRRATRAAHKLPKDWEDQCERSFFRKVYIIKEEDIPSALYANSDQTQVKFSPSDSMSYAPTGAKQVSVVGLEDKRAFTLLVTVTADGTLLPLQAVYVGLTDKSLPHNDAPFSPESLEEGFRFEFSGTKTYWSNQRTMRDFVNHILAPYFDRMKEKLGLPETQKALWQIDVWSVHRLQEFRDWMKKQHPAIVLDYVPGGCTGVHQPCDVGIQRPLKLSIRRSYHEDIVEEFREKLEKTGKVASIDEKVATL